MVNNFQRLGAMSNAHAGKAFEDQTIRYFRQQGQTLRKGYSVPVGYSYKKNRTFDLGSESPPVLIECKSHTWTSGGNVPSAKITVWNEAMYYFALAPKKYRKILFVLRDFNAKRSETLAQYYVRNYGHLIPEGVEVLEYDGSTGANAVN